MSDQELLQLLREDPEAGAEQLIAQYSGLLWSLAGRYLSRPEDIRECVNDTFAEFFCHMERFQSEKGSLKGYLAAIARRLAIRQYWEGRQRDPSQIQPDTPQDPFARLEQLDELEAALKTLEPLDETIIRMKYYNGMTAREIAASLDLPYETVKKHHQRSLKKLLKALTVGLVVAALLAACAYVVLRYFGIVPGYGVNTDPNSAIYVLEHSESTETDDYRLTVTDAWWSDGVFIADASLYYTDPPAPPGEATPDPSPQFALEGPGEIGSLTVIHRPTVSGDETSLRIMAGVTLAEPAGATQSFTLLCDGTPLSLTLRPAAEELTPEEAGYYSMSEDEGGLLAIPRLENGELIVSLYPLNAGAFQTDIGLTQGVWAGFGAPSAPVTATAADGSVLTGHPLNYSPYSGDAYLDWSFGPAEPGEYTLTVPYVYQTAAEGGICEETLLLPESNTELDLTFVIPGGSVTLGTLAPTEPVEVVPCGETFLMFPDEMYGDYLWWSLEAELTAASPERIPAAVPFSVSQAGGGDAEIHLRTRMEADPAGGMIFLLQDYLLLTNASDQSLTLRLDTAAICYRWEHPFHISFQVSE